MRWKLEKKSLENTIKEKRIKLEKKTIKRTEFKIGITRKDL